MAGVLCAAVTSGPRDAADPFGARAPSGAATAAVVRPHRHVRAVRQYRDDEVVVGKPDDGIRVPVRFRPAR